MSWGVGFVSIAILVNINFHASFKASDFVDKSALKSEVKEMFLHAYYSYKNNAFPADELMPLSCKGRYRWLEKSRGDIDDALGNFSLTMLDSLDSLFLFGELDEFESAVKLVLTSIKFDSDLDVSVFETNIRVLGGLLSAHIAALTVRNKSNSRMSWYQDDLLKMAFDIGTRLLPAFNTSTGIPYPRVNLRYGCTGLKRQEAHTCTACAGTMILEFATLSRLTGNPIFEEKAATALAYLWKQRNRYSDLVGKVINVHNGDWVRQESGVGAGIDSYYEYLLKAYVLLGEPVYLHRFHTHYKAINRYVSGPSSTDYPFLFLDVHMHKPGQRSRTYMDALLAFWPGLQVLVGDVTEAIALHELLFLTHKYNKLLPEAFTPDLKIHWGQHLLRPELIESTYLLYQATQDPYYLKVGAQLVSDLQKYARVPCGFAAIKDVRTMEHSDQMDSFVLAETFKYLYLLFAETSDLSINLDDYIFTTEAHLLPLSITRLPLPTDLTRLRAEFDISDQQQYSTQTTFTQQSLTMGSSSPFHYHGDRDYIIEKQLNRDAKCMAFGLNVAGQSNCHLSSPLTSSYEQSVGYCPKSPFLLDNILLTNASHMFTLHKRTSKSNLWVKFDTNIRQPLRELATNVRSKKWVSMNPQYMNTSTVLPLRAMDFQPDNAEHLNLLKQLGISFVIDADGKLSMTYHQELAENSNMAVLGLLFIQDLMSLTKSKQQLSETLVQIRHVVLLDPPSFGLSKLLACPAHFGHFPGEVIADNSTANYSANENYDSIRSTNQTSSWKPILGPLRIVQPIDACRPITNVGFAYPSSFIQWNGDISDPLDIVDRLQQPDQDNQIALQSRGPIAGSIGLVRRGGCLFVEKARNLASAGVIGGIVLDTNPKSSAQNDPLFVMSGDKDELSESVHIPFVLLFAAERNKLLDSMRMHWTKTERPQYIILTKEYNSSLSFNMALEHIINEDMKNYEDEFSSDFQEDQLAKVELVSSIYSTNNDHQPQLYDPSESVGLYISNNLNSAILPTTAYNTTSWIFTLYIEKHKVEEYFIPKQQSDSFQMNFSPNVVGFVNNMSLWRNAFDLLLETVNISLRCKQLIMGFTQIALHKTASLNSITYSPENVTVPTQWFYLLDHCLTDLQSHFSVPPTDNGDGVNFYVDVEQVCISLLLGFQPIID